MDIAITEILAALGFCVSVCSVSSISRAEYDHTMQLFFLKEYSEWVYCAGISGDYEMEYYKKYYPKAKDLSKKLGF